MSIIEFRGVSKKYVVNNNNKFSQYLKGFLKKDNKKSINAVNNVSFSIDEGEVIGLVGVNGAGKSTIIKMLTGILSPTQGEIIVMGKDPCKYRRDNNYKIAAVFGQRCQLRWDVSAFESYKLLKKIYRVSDDKFEAQLSKLSKILNLQEFINQPIRTLSLGQKMRAEIGAAFLHSPKIVFLDEPTLGLDVFSKDAMLEFLLQIKKNTNTTLILTTHDLEDIEKVCDRLIIIDKGKVLVDDTKENILVTSEVGHNVYVKFNNKDIKLSELFKDIDYELDEVDKSLKIKNISQNNITAVMRSLFELNDVKNFQVQNPEFKDVFKEIFTERHKKIM